MRAWCLGFVALSQLVLWVTPARAHVVDRVAAIAGEHVIMLSEVRQRASVYLVAAATEKDPLARAKMEAKAMYTACEELIDDLLIGDEAARLHLTTSNDEIDRTIDEIAKSNNLSRAALLDTAREEGVTESNYRAMLHAKLLEGKVLQLRHATESTRDRVTAELHAELRGRVYVEDRVAKP